MSVNLGLYDIFANIIPGFFYFYLINELVRLLSLRGINYGDIDSLAEIIGIGLISFVLGHLLNSITYDKWYRLFHPQDDSESVLNGLREWHPDLNLRFRPHDIEILFTIIQLENKQVADRFENNRANAIMMRNISFGFFLFSLLQIGYYLVFKNPVHLLFSAGGILIVFLAFNQSIKYYKWFNRDVFRAAIAYGSSLKSVLSDVRKRNMSNKEKV